MGQEREGEIDGCPKSGTGQRNLKVSFGGLGAKNDFQRWKKEEKPLWLGEVPVVKAVYQKGG